VNKNIGIGIGIVAVAIAVAFAYSYSILESDTEKDVQKEENIAIQEKATPNVQAKVTESGKEITIVAEDRLGLQDRP